jgi:hypothetical protein
MSFGGHAPVAQNHENQKKISSGVTIEIFSRIPW